MLHYIKGFFIFLEITKMQYQFSLIQGSRVTIKSILSDVTAMSLPYLLCSTKCILKLLSFLRDKEGIKKTNS